jgi:PKHD-type hydroxylase
MMLITISDLLDAESLSEVKQLVATLAWKDGAQTAGVTAAQVKHNQQADLTSRMGAKLRKLLMAAIVTHPVFVAAARPRQFTPLLVSKTGNGGGYGLHVDNPFMGTAAGQIRTDVSFTLFLSDPDTYQGGELVIEHAGATQSLKLKAGDMVVYPSTSLHQVAPVSKGERVVCVGWAESLIARPDDRETLFDLANLKATLSETHDPQSPEMLTLSKAIANLLRRFS